MNADAAASASGISPTRWLALAGILVAIKLLWLLADHAPMLFLGDSESYLATAVTGWIPPDRSFLYGFLLRLLAVETGSLLPVLAAQSACGVVAALVLADLLTRSFAIGPRAAIAVAIAWAAAEPLALMYERYLMTEAFALVAVAAFVRVSIRYIDTRRLRDVVLAQAAATLVIAFRAAFVPVSLCFAFALPVLAWARRRGNGGAATTLRGLALALLASIAATALFHHAYKTVSGELRKMPPAYQYADGFFLLAAWSPVLEARDFDDRALGESIIALSECKQADRYSREAQRWGPGCIVDRLRQRVADEGRANEIARNAAYRALLRNPAGVANLALATWLDIFRPVRMRIALSWDRGEVAFQPALVALLRDRFGVAGAAELDRLETPTRRWQSAAGPWVMLLAVAPFVALLALAVCPAAVRRNMAFVALLAACIVGASAIASTAPVARYYHAIAWLTTIPLAVIGSRLAGMLLRSSR